MAVGLEIYNDSGLIQVTGDSFNFGFVSKGTATFSTILPGAGSAYYTDISIPTSTYAIIAIKPNTTGLAINASMFMGSYVSGGNTVYRYAGTNGATIDYYIFDRFDAVTVGSDPNIGLEIFSSTGARIFHSNAKSMKVVGTGTTAIPGGKVYAGVQSGIGFYETSTVINPTNSRYRSYMAGVFITATGNIDLGYRLLENYLVPNETPYDYSPASPPTLVVLDVTGY